MKRRSKMIIRDKIINRLKIMMVMITKTTKIIMAEILISVYQQPTYPFSLNS